MAQKTSTRQRATALIFKADTVLMIRRNRDDFEGFIFPGGGVEEGETPEQGLIREVMEELSVQVETYEYIGMVQDTDIEIPNRNPIPKQDCYCYIITKYAGELEIGAEDKARMTPTNTYTLVWMPISDLRKLGFVYPADVIALVESHRTK